MGGPNTQRTSSKFMYTPVQPCMGTPNALTHAPRHSTPVQGRTDGPNALTPTCRHIRCAYPGAAPKRTPPCPHAPSTPSPAGPAQPRTHLHAEAALVCPDEAVGHDAAGRPHPQAPALGQPGLGAQQEGAGHVPPQQRDPGVPGDEAAVGPGWGRARGGAGLGVPRIRCSHTRTHLAMPAKAHTLSARTLSFSGRKAKLLAPLLSHPAAAAGAR